MFNLGTGEIIFILIIVLLLFGPRRLPDLADSVGKSIRIFKNSMRGDSPNETKRPDTKDDKPV